MCLHSFHSLYCRILFSHTESFFFVSYVLFWFLHKYYLSSSHFTKCNIYEGHLESKERFAIQRYLLIIGKKKNMQIL